MLMLFTALRISETVTLDVDDVRITARKGLLVVLGKGELRREVPLNALVRQVLDEWLEQRKTLARDGERALWVSRTGGRLSARSADRDVRAVAARAGLAQLLVGARAPAVWSTATRRDRRARCASGSYPRRRAARGR